MSAPLIIHRVLGDHPFAEIGVPSAVAVGEERGVVVVGGDLGALRWSGGRGGGYGWRAHRIAVYGADDLRCRRLVESRWPVHSLALHPTLPLLAVGTGAYDGGYAFEGELLLVDLESGRCRSMMRSPREILKVGWESARELRLLVAPRDDDNECEEAHTHAYDVLVERPDWAAAPRGSVQQKELAGQWVEREEPTGDAVERLAELVGEPWWEPRRQVWDVRGLPDGRVLACLDEVLAEAWLPDGRLDWCVGDEEGGRQLAVRDADAWVNVERWRERWVGRERVVEPPLVARVSLADGKTIGTLGLGFPVRFTQRRDGWLALCSTGSDTSFRPRPRPVALITPAGETPSRTVELGGLDAVEHSFPVRRSSRLLFLQGDERAPHLRQRVVEVDPDEPSAPRPLFPLDWRSPARQLSGGPGVEIGTDLVYAGVAHDTSGPALVSAFVVRRSPTDGAIRWEFAADRGITALDGDAGTVYVAFNSGELIALNAEDGSVRWRHRLKIDGLSVAPLSLELTASDRLLIGTVDGRILDCSTTP